MDPRQDPLPGRPHGVRLRARSYQILRVQIGSEAEDPCGERKRLREEALFVRIGEKNIVEVTSYSIAEALDFFEKPGTVGNYRER